MSGLYSWVVNVLPIPLSDIRNLKSFSLKKIVFPYCVGVRSFENLCDGRKVVLQYGDSVQSFPKDSIFACKTKSVWKPGARISTCNKGIHSNFC